MKTTKTTRKQSVVCAVLCALALCLSACTATAAAAPQPSATTPYADTPQGISLVIVLGKHANANDCVAETLTAYQPLIEKAFTCTVDSAHGQNIATGQISVIVADGNPTAEPLTEEVGVRLTATSRTPEKCALDITTMSENLIAYLASDAVKAAEEEVDLLAAISEASTILQNNPGAENHILFIDPGISTTGYFDMTAIDVQSASPDEIVAQIPAGGIPDLANTFLTVAQLGNVAAPQVDLRSDNAFKAQFIGVWEAIFTKSAASLTSPLLFAASEGTPLTYVESGDDYPFVSSVPFMPTEVARVEQAPVVLSNSALGFLPDRAVFRDEIDAQTMIDTQVSAVNAFLASSETACVYIVGSIAQTQEGEHFVNHPLSLARAEAVRELLVCGGVDESRLVVIDTGTTPFSWRNASEFEGGTCSPENQQANRVVTLIASGSNGETELVQAGYLTAS